MMTLYQRRGTGKTSGLILQSNFSGLPIAVATPYDVQHLQWLANEVLHTTIPKPFVATPEACRKAGKYLVDEGGHVLQNLLGGEIVLMTMTDEGDKEWAEYFDKHVLKV